MTDTEANLMISDEENGNLYSGRSFQDKLGATKSPSSNQKFLNTQELLASAESKRDVNYFNSPQSQNKFNHPEKSESHQQPSNPQHSSKEGVKQTIRRDSEEEGNGITSDMSGKKNLKKLISDNKSSDKSNLSRSEQATVKSQNHTAPDVNTPEQRHSNKDHHQGEEEHDENGQNRSRKVKSAHNSHNGPSVRYSKMSEEDAANIFENRKKELLNNLMKKNSSKKGGEKENIVENQPQPHPRPVLDSPTSKETKNGFVVFKSNNPQKTGAPQKSESAKETERKYSKPQIQRPHSSARNSDPNTANPNSRKKPTIEIQTSTNKKTPANNAFLTPKTNSGFRSEKIFETGGKSSAAKSNAKDDNRDNRINVNLKKPGKGYSSQHRDSSSTSKVESSNKTSQRDIEQQLYQQYEDEYRQNQMYLQKYSHQQLQEQINYTQQQYHNQYQNLPPQPVRVEKKQEILYEIQNIDQEIQMLESENSSPPANQFAAHQRSDSNKRSDSRDKRPSSSNQGSNQKITQNNTDRYLKDGKYYIDDNVRSEREKIHKINELMESKKNHRINNNEYLESEPQQNVNDESLNIPLTLNKSYNVLNQKVFNKRYDYLYERALVQKNARELLAERSKQIKEKKELRKCTFSPDINQNPNQPYEDIISKTRKWQIQKEKTVIENEREKVRQELEGCTFYPNGMLDREEDHIFDSNSFYKKNIEWQKRVEAAALRKKEELYTSIMTGPEKSRIQNSTLSFSKLNTSNSHLNTSNSQPKRDGTPKSTKNAASSKVGTPGGSNTKKAYRSPSQKELASKRSDSKTNLKLEISTSKKNDSFYSDRKTTAPKSTTNEELTQKQLQSQILESYALLDNLKGYVSSRRETIERKDSEAKESLEKKLKTTRMKTESSVDRKETPTRKSSNNSVIMQSIRREISSKGLPSPKQGYLKGESPLNGRGTPGKNSSRELVATSTDDRSGTVSSGRLVVKKNRYYVEEPSERGDRGSRRSSQSRDQSLRSPSMDNKPSSNLNSNPHRRTPDKRPPKTTLNTAYTSPSTIYYPHPFESQFVSPRADPSFQSPRSPIYISNSNALTSPSGANLENKYLELLSQVSKVTSQIEKIKSSNSSLQNDIYSMKSGNGKRSMYG